MSFTAYNAAGPPPTAARNVPVYTPPGDILNAFIENPKLATEIKEFLETYPETTELFTAIATHITALKTRLAAAQQPASAVPAAAYSTAETIALTSQAPKKRKLESEAAAPVPNLSLAGWADRSTRPDFITPDVSFSIPVRKKLRLECLGSKTGGLRGVSADGGTFECGMNWADVRVGFCLPVPEKAKKTHNFVIMPRDAAAEPIVWTVNESAPSEEGPGTDAEPARTVRYLSTQLARFQAEVVLPDEEEFVSAMPSGRKGEKSYHVKAHRGSKEGYLYPLAPGLLWAFKKPLLFMPFSAIVSVSYTSILQRTFNMNVLLTFNPANPKEESETEVEFSMIDQADFAGIDAYVKAHGLHDASLAAQRKATVYGVNKAKGRGKKGDEANGDGVADANGEELEDGETELQRAERILQDQEDEEEEDYVDEGSEEGSSEEEGYEEEAYGGGGGEEMEEED